MIKLHPSVRALLAVLVVGVATCGLSAHAQSPADAGHEDSASSGGVVQKVERSADKAVHATERTTRKVVRGTERTSRKAVHATERTAGKVGSAVGHAARHTAGALRRTGDKIGEKLPKGKPAPHVGIGQ